MLPFFPISGNVCENKDVLKILVRHDTIEEGSVNRKILVKSNDVL